VAARVGGPLRGLQLRRRGHLLRPRPSRRGRLPHAAGERRPPPSARRPGRRGGSGEPQVLELRSLRGRLRGPDRGGGAAGAGPSRLAVRQEARGRADGGPAMTETERRRERLEVWSWLLFAVSLGAMEGGVVSVMVKTFYRHAVAAPTLDYTVAVLV